MDFIKCKANEKSFITVWFMVELFFIKVVHYEAGMFKIDELKMWKGFENE